MRILKKRNGRSRETEQTKEERDRPWHIKADKQRQTKIYREADQKETDRKRERPTERDTGGLRETDRHTQRARQIDRQRLRERELKKKKRRLEEDRCTYTKLAQVQAPHNPWQSMHFAHFAPLCQAALCTQHVQIKFEPRILSRNIPGIKDIIASNNGRETSLPFCKKLSCFSSCISLRGNQAFTRIVN